MAYHLLPTTPYASYDEYLNKHPRGELPALLKSETAEDLLSELRRSGLRGRGGAGFPTGTKWTTIARHACPTRDVVCNAAEGEPGTYKDRWLLLNNPYATLEGMAIASKVIGARSVNIAMKASFTEVVARVRAAIDEMASRGVFDGYEVNLVEGPEDYLFGEEKALLNVVDGHNAMPRPAHNPPYEWGLRPSLQSPNPALVNNAETFAHVANIVRGGADAFRARGTPDTPGTILFTVCGDVEKPQVVELDAGITLRELLYQHAGGPRAGRSFKAVLSGVASAVIPATKLDTPLDFGSMQLIGSGLGAAGLIVIDDSRSMVQVARSVASFLYRESCAQCSACKVGLRTAADALHRLAEHVDAPTPEVLLTTARRGAKAAPQDNRCYLPVQGSILIPSIMNVFASEFEEVAKGRDAGPVWELPKLVGYDPERGQFMTKSDLLPPSPPAPEAAPSVSEPEPTIPLGASPLFVALAPDVARLFEFVGEDELAAQVNDALRRYLARGEPSGVDKK